MTKFTTAMEGAPTARVPEVRVGSGFDKAFCEFVMTLKGIDESERGGGREG